MAPLVQHHAPVDDDGGDAGGILERIGEGRAIGDRGRIEDHQVRGQPLLDQPAIRDVQLRGGEAAHLVDRLFERDHLLLADVLAEDAREGAEAARVRHTGAERPARRQRGSVGADRDPRLLHRQLEVPLVDDEPDAADAAVVRDQDLEDEVVGVFSRRLRRLVDAHALVLLVGGLPDRGELDVVPRAGGDQPVLPYGMRVVHLPADSGARRRILQPLGQPGAAAFVRPRRNRLRQAGAACDVGVLIGGELDAAPARRVDQRDDFLHPPEVLRAGDLEVEDVDRDARAFADRDRLLDPLAQLLAVVAQVRRVETAGGARRPRQRDQLVGPGVGVGRVDQAGRHAVGALRHRLGDQARHLLELVRLRRPLVVAHHQLAHLAEADVREQVDRGPAAFDGREVAGEVAPPPLGGRRLRRDRAALADHLGGHPLPDLALGVAVGEQGEIGVGVRIDEARREHLAPGVDGARRRARDAPDAGDPSVAHRDRSGDRGAAAAVDDAGVGDEEIEGPRRRLRRDRRDAERGGGREGELEACHGRIICRAVRLRV